MSNKLIKNKNSTSKELEYYKKHCSLLEKELEEERKKRTQLEITLSCGSEPSNHAVSELRNLIKSYKIAKETEEKLCNELLDMKKDLKKKLIELDKIKPLYIKKCEEGCDDILRKYTKMVKVID
ncbi:hypothetical protein [Lachnospira eligens]|jgi:hypothetical protein|uniref:Uncharacterized protein n=1 Tax=Lachnospira eligens TaxID=39485 RepID=A0A415MEC4_9FIRM|nr:hypothetical protein [Lachnospira eligens]RHA50376.1 hypothetical protein DW933_02065 [Lachnospira eligens]RHL71216.1 hypothetical protein DW007_03470 [Lachnospira eligens]